MNERYDGSHLLSRRCEMHKAHALVLQNDVPFGKLATNAKNAHLCDR